MNEAIGRLHLENVIGEAQRRNAARAAQDVKQRTAHARDEVAVTIAQHPFVTMGGALVLGIVIGSMLPRRRITARTAALSAMVAETALAYGREALDKAREAVHTIEEHTSRK